MAKRQSGEKSGDWLFIVPISNLILSKEIGREIRIERVIFIHRDKLPRIRKRLGLTATISELAKLGPGRAYKDFFESAETFAVMRQKGRVSDIEVDCYRIVKDAISILTISQLGYARRRFNPHVGILGEYETPRFRRVFISTRDISRNYGGRVTGGIGDLALTGHWRQFQKDAFFFNLLKILHAEINVHSTWRDDLRRASILIGQSLNSNDLSTSFLWNMIALERLVTRRGDKYTSALPERIEAILGWVGFWSTRGYEAKIREIYRKRSELVHTGNVADISKRDLLFTDDLLFNLLVNLLSFPKIFQSKDDVIRFADKVKAEHTLGMKSKVRPKKLVFYSRSYSERDFDEI